MKTGIVIFAHGSRLESANDAVRRTAASMAAMGGYDMAVSAFLEGGKPDLPEAAASLARQGAERIVVIPYFLTLGTHMQRDLPVIVQGILEAHPGLEIQVTPPLDGHPALEEILLDRARKALK